MTKSKKKIKIKIKIQKNKIYRRKTNNFAYSANWMIKKLFSLNPNLCKKEIGLPN